MAQQQPLEKPRPRNIECFSRRQASNGYFQMHDDTHDDRWYKQLPEAFRQTGSPVG